jgi:uncharacterized membrane protein YedE/YeeE
MTGRVSTGTIRGGPAGGTSLQAAAPCWRELLRYAVTPGADPARNGRPQMSIDWSAFTPWPALAGGIVIGLAAALFVLIGGRISGISGIVGGLLGSVPGDRAWRVAFVAGLVLAPAAYALVAPVPVPMIDAGHPLLVVSGLLVGAGTRCASGCTSGHGVCGLSNLSPRSLVATACFMGAGIATVFVSRHVVGG